MCVLLKYQFLPKPEATAAEQDAINIADRKKLRSVQASTHYMKLRDSTLNGFERGLIHVQSHVRHGGLFGPTPKVYGHDIPTKRDPKAAR